MEAPGTQWKLEWMRESLLAFMWMWEPGTP